MIAFVNQVHGRGVAVVAVGRLRRLRAARRRRAGHDAARASPLAVLVADCLPVLLADPAAGSSAPRMPAGAAWPPACCSAPSRRWRRSAPRPADIVAVIGPGVCGRCYEVPAAMRDEVGAVVPGSAATTRARDAGAGPPAGRRRSCSQRSASGRSGVPAICTMEDDRFFSYRRDGVTGRFAGVVMLATVTDRRDRDRGRDRGQPRRLPRPGRRGLRRRRPRPGRAHLVAVTKTFPAADVRLLAELGVTDVGENRDQEAAAKHAECADLPLRWHFVGRLQTQQVPVGRGVRRCRPLGRPDPAGRRAQPRPRSAGPHGQRAGAGLARSPARRRAGAAPHPDEVLALADADRGGAGPARSAA